SSSLCIAAVRSSRYSFRRSLRDSASAHATESSSASSRQSPNSGTHSPEFDPVTTASWLSSTIGGKILSGRTKDQNIGYIAEYLTAIGIDLKEVRVVGDEERHRRLGEMLA